MPDFVDIGCNRYISSVNSTFGESAINRVTSLSSDRQIAIKQVCWPVTGKVTPNRRYAILTDSHKYLEALDLMTNSIVRLPDDQTLAVMVGAAYSLSFLLRNELFTDTHAYLFYCGAIYRAEYITSKLEKLIHICDTSYNLCFISKYEDTTKEELSIIEHFNLYQWVGKSHILYFTRPKEILVVYV